MSITSPSPSLSYARLVLPDISKYTRQFFTLSCNPSLLEGEAASHAWFDSYAILSGFRRERFFKYRFCLLASLCYPDATLDHLRPAMGSLLWLFAFDDMADLGDLRLEGPKRAMDITMSVLHSPDVDQPNLKIAATLLSFFNRMRQNGNPQAIRHFVEATESYTQAITQEMTDKDAGYVQTLEEYKNYRQDTSAVKLVLATLEYAHDINIPDEILQDPVISELSLAGNDIIAWSNDIYSFPKEHARAQTHNLVFVIMWHNRLELQDAVDHANHLIEQRVQDYLRAKAKLRSFGPSLDTEVARYVRGMEYCIQACIDWSFMTTRYFGADVAKVKETRTVDIVPRVMLADLSSMVQQENQGGIN